MARSRIGPLALEAPLGSPRSTVFRAIHVEQRIQVAVRVFSVPMGMTPEAKRDFTEQMEQLKKLRHPGIVRCLGGGFDKRDAFLVYELVEGQSLDVLLARRERLPWEIVLQYGIELCEALQAAHDARWIHGRIRPDKLILTSDETQIKLSDFRRETQAANMLGAIPTPELLAYTSPELIKGQGAITQASDLYSLGAVLYHMLTGAPPFSGGNVSQIKAAIVEQPVAPVATIVFDCPIWLSTIVEQLLDKNPQRRPFSATALALGLKEAQRRAAQGVGVAQHAASGFSPLQMNADRKEAERVLGRTPKKQKRSRDDAPPLFERPWFLVVCLALAGCLIVFFMLPLSERALRARAEKLLATEEISKWTDASDYYLKPLVERFPNSENSDWAREQLDKIEMAQTERQINRKVQFGRQPLTESELQYTEANRYERFGDRVTALNKYRAISNLYSNNPDHRPVVNLALRQIRQIEAKPPSIEELRKFLSDKLAEADRFYASGDVISSKIIWESILNLYNGNIEMLAIVQQAQSRLDKIK